MKILSYFLNPTKQERKAFSNESSYYYFLLASTTSLFCVVNIMAVLLRYQGMAPVLMYLILSLTIGLPMILCQILLAQYSKTIKIFRISPLWVGTLYAMIVLILCQAHVEVHYAAIMLHYAENVIVGSIGWLNCSNFKSDDSCTDGSKAVFSYMTCCSFDERFITEECHVYRKLEFVSYDFYLKKISLKKYTDDGWFLKIEDIINRAFLWLIIYHLLMLEIDSLEKCVKYVMVLFTAVSCYILFLTFWLPGSTLALGSILRVKREQYADFKLYGEIYNHVLTTYELSTGSIILYSVWTKEPRNIVTDSVFIFVFRLVMNILCVVWVIGLLGITAYKYGVTDFDCYLTMQYRTSSLPLMTEALSMFPSARFHMALYFPFYCFLQILHTTLMLNFVVEQFPRVKRWIPVLIICVIEFLFCMPTRFYRKYFHFFRILLLSNMRVTIMYAFSIAVFLSYGAGNLCDDMTFLMGYRPVAFWRYSWYLYIPALTILTYSSFIGYLEIQYILKKNQNVVTVFHIFGASFVGIIVLGIIVQIFWYSVRWKLPSAFKPDKKWGPADRSKRLQRRFFSPGTSERYRDPNYRCTHTCLRGTKAVKQKELVLQKKRAAYLEFINPTEEVSVPQKK